MSQPTGPHGSGTPQDAPATEPVPTTPTSHLPTTQWPTWVPQHPQPHPAGTSAQAPAQATQPVAPVAPAPPPQPAPRPAVTRLPPPGGPNWGLVLVGLLFGLAGIGVVANQVNGFVVADLQGLGPHVLVMAGLACAVLGIVGILSRRRRG